jgi:hypothetical protein
MTTSLTADTVDVAPGLLAKAVLAELNDDAEGLDQEVSSLIEEARRLLKIEPGDRSQASRQAVADALSRTLTSRILPETSIEEVRKRLGRSGALATRDYTIQIDSEVLSRYRFRETAARTLLSTPDAVQHLEPTSESDLQVSLFVKLIRPSRGEAYIAMAVARRIDDILDVHALWRLAIERDDTWPATPLQILERFVERFGVPFRVGDDSSEKLFVFFRRILRTKTEGGRASLLQLRADRQRTSSVLASSLMKVSTDNKHLDMALVYAIDAERYEASLRRLGIHVSQI